MVNIKPNLSRGVSPIPMRLPSRMTGLTRGDWRRKIRPDKPVVVRTQISASDAFLAHAFNRRAQERAEHLPDRAGFAKVAFRRSTRLQEAVTLIALQGI